jgi:hypothetical protein
MFVPYIHSIQENPFLKKKGSSVMKKRISLKRGLKNISEANQLGLVNDLPRVKRRFAAGAKRPQF